MINNAVLAILWDPNDHSTQKEDKEKWKLPRLHLTFLPKDTMYPFSKTFFTLQLLGKKRKSQTFCH